jgi:hypothetical protein
VILAVIKLDELLYEDDSANYVGSKAVIPTVIS